MAVTTLGLAQLFNCFNARSDTTSAFYHSFTNRLLWAAIAFSVLMQIAVVHLSILNDAFNTTHPCPPATGCCARRWPASFSGPTKPRSCSNASGTRPPARRTDDLRAGAPAAGAAGGYPWTQAKEAGSRCGRAASRPTTRYR